MNEREIAEEWAAEEQEMETKAFTDSLQKLLRKNSDSVNESEENKLIKKEN